MYVLRLLIALTVISAGCGPGVEEGAPRRDAAADRGSRDVAADQAPGADGADAWVCREYHASKLAHEDAGRAYRCGQLGSYVCAKGSDENLGLWNIEWIWLEETAANYFKRGRCGD